MCRIRGSPGTPKRPHDRSNWPWVAGTEKASKETRSRGVPPSGSDRAVCCASARAWRWRAATGRATAPPPHPPRAPHPAASTRTSLTSPADDPDARHRRPRNEHLSIFHGNSVPKCLLYLYRSVNSRPMGHLSWR